MIDHENNYCPICDAQEKNPQKELHHATSAVKKGESQDDISFAVLLALVPAMTMTLFNLMGLI